MHDECPLLFNSEYYRQLGDVTIGPPLSPLLVDIFLAKPENGPLKDSISHLTSYYCHKDDNFIVLRGKNEKDSLLNIHVSIHPFITFTLNKNIVIAYGL